MKTYNKILMTLGVAASVFAFSSCVDDLNQSPTNPNEITDVTNDIDRVFADVYLNFATFGANGDSPVKDFDGGMAGFQRAIFTAEEMPTDEACWLWDPADYGTLNYGVTVPSLNAVFGFYSRLMINITLCNQFIQQVNDGAFNLDAEGQKRAEDYVRQAKILRGLCYYYMMSFYSNPPYADENTALGEEPSQPGRAQVYANVTSQLEEIVDYYKANPRAEIYGFVGLNAAEALLAKIYLNGEVFAGQGDYAKCYQHSKAVIDRLGNGGYYGNGLARSYKTLFGYNNDQYSVGHPGNSVNEIIWTIPQNRVELTSWAGATFMVAAWVGTNGVQVTLPKPLKTTDPSKNGELDYDNNEKYYYTGGATEEEQKENEKAYKEAKDAYDKAAGDKSTVWKTEITYSIGGVHYSFDPTAVGHVSSDWFNSGDGWKCMVARKSFVRKFDWTDVEMTTSNDTRVDQWLTYAYGFTVENPSLVGDDWGSNGYLCPKYSNWAYDEDGTINLMQTPPSSTPFGGDYAVIRLAEVYLMAAEAIQNGGGGSEAEALQYVNYIRQRAYGDNYTPWTSLSAQDLRDERCRELYQENNRRTDLIRWNQWCTGYTWEWKGGMQTGTNLPEYTKSYPIPSRVMTSSHLQQMPGY